MEVTHEYLYVAIKLGVSFMIGFTVGTAYNALVEFNWLSYGMLMAVMLYYFLFHFNRAYDALMEKIGLGPEIS